MEGSEMATEGRSIYCTIIFYDKTLVYGRRKIKTNEILQPERTYDRGDRFTKILGHL